MRYKTIASVGVALALVLSACGSAAQAESSPHELCVPMSSEFIDRLTALETGEPHLVQEITRGAWFPRSGQESDENPGELTLLEFTPVGSDESEVVIWLTSTYDARGQAHNDRDSIAGFRTALTDNVTMFTAGSVFRAGQDSPAGRVTDILIASQDFQDIQTCLS